MNNLPVGIFILGDFFHCRYSDHGRQVRETTMVRVAGVEGSPEFAKSLKGAEKFLNDRKRAVESRTFIAGENRLKLEQVLDNYLGAYTSGKFGGKALKSTEMVLRHVRKYFAGWRVRDLTAPRLRDYVKHRHGEDAADASIAREVGHLRAALGRAVKDGLLSGLPAKEFPTVTVDNARTGFIKPADFLRLRTELKTELMQDFVTFLYWSAWRSNEAKKLEWNDIDLAEGKITLPARKNKTGKRRKLRLFGELKEMIARRVASRRQVSVYVFEGKDGKELRDVGYAFVTAAARAGLGHITPHDCRRSAIRNLVRAGVPTSVCMTWSGHLTGSVFKRYDITDDEDLDIAAEKVEAYVTGEQAKVPAKVVQISAKQQPSKTLANKGSDTAKSA
jgi:integrase